MFKISTEYCDGSLSVVLWSAAPASRGRLLGMHVLEPYPIRTTTSETLGVGISNVIHFKVQEPLTLSVHSADGEKYYENWYFICVL